MYFKTWQVEVVEYHASVPRFMNLRSLGAKTTDSIKSHTDVFNAIDKVLVTFMHECIFLDESFVSDRNIGWTKGNKKLAILHSLGSQW